LNIQLQQIYSGHSDAVYALEKGLTDQIFFSGSADTFVGSWNVLTGTFEKPLIKTSAPIYSLLPDLPEQLIYVGCRGGLLYQVDISRRKAPRALEAHDKDVFCLAIDHLHQRLISGGGDGSLKVWTLPDLKLITAFKLSESNIRTLSISPSGKQLAVGSSDQSIRIFDLNSLHQTAFWVAHQPSVFTLTWLNEHVILSGGRDALLKQWTTGKDGLWTNELEIAAHNYTINHLQISPNGQYVATAGRDKAVKIWSADDLRLLKVLDRPKFEAAHTHSVNRVLWLDDHTLLSAGDDKRIISWHLRDI
jgi:WD repeat-containing protein 61